MTIAARKRASSGFTLVELAIVLVIIGLLVGGVLVGQDLIKAAGINATVSQFEDYNSAANTFRTKFGGLPGDLSSGRAVQFGLQARNGNNGLGDGDGQIESTTTAQGLWGETSMFWSDLSAADLISDAFSVAIANAAAPALTATDIPNHVPNSKLRDAAYFHVYGIAGRNFFYLGGIGSTTAATSVIAEANQLSPAEAYSIDEKLDDGDGDSGNVMAINVVTTNAEATNNAGGSTDCFSDANGTYNLAEANRENTNCRISARTSF